jgi:hypothetical protein
MRGCIPQVDGAAMIQGGGRQQALTLELLRKQRADSFCVLGCCQTIADPSLELEVLTIA